MKRLIFTLFFALVMSGLTLAQLTGVKTIPGDYANVESAIIALNTLGVGTGGVTFEVATGHTETFTTRTAGLITISGSADSPIVFQKSGVGSNPQITGCPTAATTTDYIIALRGTDYITFDGIDVKEPTGVVEWGYAVMKDSTMNGAQYVTIRNCTISLKSSNTATIGIYSANVTPTNPGTQLSVDAPNGTNSYNKFYSNTISGCYQGIVVDGFNDPNLPYAYYDQSNEIGKDGGNTIQGFGGSTVASNGIKTSYQDRLYISNNIISGNVIGNGASYGIQLGTAKNANVTISNNTVSITRPDATTAAFTGIYGNMGTSFVNNTVSIYGNSVSNCSSPKATTGAVRYMDIGISSYVYNIYQNIIQNNSVGSATATATGEILGIRMSGSIPTDVVAPNVYIYSNTISGNSRTQSVAAAGIHYAMYLLGGKLGTVIHVKDNLISQQTNSGTGLLAGIYVLTGASEKWVYRNTIQDFTNNSGQVYGIYTGEGYTQYIHSNIFRNLKSNAVSVSSTIGLVVGIYASGSSNNGPMYLYNNMISELKTPRSKMGVSITGIYGLGTGLTLLGVYNNTVYLDGTSDSTGFGSAAAYFGSAPASVDLRNNVFVNNSTPTGGGVAAAVRSNGYNYFSVGPANYSATVNNNLYYVGASGSNHIVFQLSDGTSLFNYQSLADYKTLVWPRECYSIDNLPSFIQTTTTPYDLHIDSSIPSQCESAGSIINTPLAISVDFDSNLRFPNAGYPDNPLYPAVAPDLGADEFAGIPSDQLAPAIVFTPLTNTAITADRELIATITDAHGVPVSGSGLPRIAWKKFTGGTWNYVDGESLGGNQYKFTFGGGVAIGDTVFYYLVAQDMFLPPAVGTYPLIGSSGMTANPPAAAVPPSNMLWYKIITGRCGTYSVGAGGKDYPTLTAAIRDLEGEGLNCPVVLELTDNSYLNETWPLIINPIAGASAVNTLTIRPAAGAAPVFSSSYLGVSPNPWSMISINGAQHIIFDGSNSNGTDRTMTFINSANGGFAAPIGLYNNGQSPASFITIKNCKLRAHSELIYNAQGFVLYNIQGSAGFHDIILDNNDINSAKFGLVLSGIASNPVYNVQVTNNTIGSMDIAQSVVHYGISFSYINNLLIEGNDLIGTATGMSYPLQSPMVIYGGTSSNNVIIRNNKIHDLWSTTNGAIGIYWDGGVTSTTLTEISNNVVYNIKSVGSNTSLDGANGVGIFIRSGSNFKIVHNTVSMQGNFLGANPSLSSCVNFRNSITGIEFRDNLLNNSAQPISGTPASKSYCIMTGTNPIFTNLNYNNYHSNGIGARVGYFGGVERNTLADWQAATGQDANSVSVNPSFFNDTTMIPTTTLMPKKGVYISSLPLDFAGVARTNPPDIGAYEFSAMPEVITTNATDITQVSATLNGSINAKGFDVNTFFDYGLTNTYGSSLPGDPALVIGNSPVAVAAAISGLEPNTTYHFRIRGVTSVGIILYGEDMTFTTSGPQCPMPTGVSATTVTATTATLSWSEPSPAPGSGYEYEIRTNGEAGSGPAGLVTSGSTITGTTTASITGLTGNTTYYAYVRSNCGDGDYSTWTSVYQFVTPAGVPVIANVTGTVAYDTCYNATDTIFVAGTPATFTVTPTGSVTLVAGMSIFLLPGTTVQSGGYLHGYITLDNQYCTQPENPVVAANLESESSLKESVVLAVAGKVIAYPNPTAGEFIVEWKGDASVVLTKLEIFNMSGAVVFRENVDHAGKYQVNIEAMKPGIYFLRAITSAGVEKLKIVKL